MQDNITKVVLNDTAKPYYPLENMARVFSAIEGAYVMVIFDCCRENRNKPEFRAGNDVQEQDNRSTYRNLILINGCSPNKKVDAKSSIATELFTKL